MIPKVFFQTDKKPVEDYVREMIMERIPGWAYEFYSDDDVLRFFEENQHKDYPDIVSVYNSFSKGAHRADLFRYYYLYIKGGFFMDSDAMIYDNINSIVKDYDFVSVDSSSHPGSIFQGIIGAAPGHPIVEAALKNAYVTRDSVLSHDYHYFCKQLYGIILKLMVPNIHLYDERRIDFNGDYIVDGNRVIFVHFWRTMRIPLKMI